MVAGSKADRSASAGNRPTTRKTSLYRLRLTGPAADQDLAAFVLPKYLERDGFTVTTVDNGGIGGLCVTGTVAPGEADWCKPLTALIGQEVSEENRTSFGLLLVRTETAVYGLAYGMGALIINPLLIVLACRFSPWSRARCRPAWLVSLDDRPQRQPIMSLSTSLMRAGS